MAETQDTEITLGTGKLLGIFFGLVTICAVFFTMGYMLGHSATPSTREHATGQQLAQQQYRKQACRRQSKH